MIDTSNIKTKQQASAVISVLEQLNRSYDVESALSDVKKKFNDLPSSIEQSVIQSHMAICKAKNMKPNDAYGWDPSIYYSSAIAGEAGEMVNGIIKEMRKEGRNSPTIKDRLIDAVKDELPDVIIYSYILAYILGIDLESIVQDKVKIVINRAEDGYYGGKLI